MKKELSIILILFIVVINMGCFEINNKENPKTKKHFEFIFTR